MNIVLQGHFRSVFRLVGLLFLWLMFQTSLCAQQRSNLLFLKKTNFDTESSSPIQQEERLRDGDTSTGVSIQIEAGQPLDVVFQFAETVTVRDAAIVTEGVLANQATIEILASTLSASVGFRSLRVEPMKASRNGSRHNFSFDPSAAKWVIVRFVPLEKSKRLSFSILELELNGYVGIPASTYLFDESPADAINVLARLSDSIDVQLSKSEKTLFEDAKDGKFDRISFAEASLLSSGVDDVEQRKELLAKIDRLESEAKKVVPQDLPTFERGQRLLEWLHAGALKRGYSAQQTDVSTVLMEETYNCVSSATLYNILARRMGLDARGIEVPDHAFSILYDGTKHVDIETTNRQGFNPARNREALERFQQATGFVYIPESNRSKRREVGDAGMVALTYYNHGVTALKEKRHGDALVGFFKALSLDANNKSAVKNVLATLGKWSGDLYTNGDTSRAIEVLEVGRELAPNDRTLRYNQKAVWQRHIKKLNEEGKPDEALKQLVKAYERTNDDQLAELQSWVFVLRGQQLVKAKNWEAALANAEEGLKVVDEKARKDLEKWKLSVLFSWSTELLDAKKYAEAIDVIELGLKSSSDWRLAQRLRYVAQQWCRQESEANGASAGNLLISELIKRFPNTHQLDQVASSLAGNAAKEFLDAKDYEAAVKVFQASRKLNPDNWRVKQNEEAVWMMWARPHVDGRRWDEAVDIYERARKSLPNVYAFQQNLTYVVQELGKDTQKEDGIVAAEKAIAKMAERFPKISGVQKLRGSRISREVSRLIKASKFDDAHQLLTEHRSFWPREYELDKMATHLYYQEAKPHLDAKEWEKAIEVFSKGSEAFPKNQKLKSNLEYGWLSFIRPLLDDEKWDQAAEVCKQAAEALPDSRKIKDTVKFVESKLENKK